MDDALFDRIQQGIDRNINEIFDAFIESKKMPSEHLVVAFSELYDCSPNEFRKKAEKYAKSKGESIFPGHY